jgi:proteasome accessory factor C
VAISDRLERLTDLILVLLDTKQPLTLEAICRAVPGYPNDANNRRQAFERDKRLLRDEGIPVVTEKVGGSDQPGYRIDRDAFYVRDLGLTDDEQSALNLAVAAVDLGDLGSQGALLKIGTGGIRAGAPIASLSPTPALVPLFAGLRSNSDVAIVYRGEKRHVVVGSLSFRGGHWYLSGWDRTRDAPRTYRVDRIEGEVEVADPSPPGDPRRRELVEALTLNTTRSDGRLWPRDDEPREELLVRVDQIEAARVCDDVGEAAVVEYGEDGSVLIKLEFPSFALLRSWVLELLDHARVVGPRTTLERYIEWLKSIVDSRRPSLDAPVELPLGNDLADRKRVRSTDNQTPRDQTPVDHEPSESATENTAAKVQPLDSKHRLRRLLAIVAWLARVRESTVEELSERFGISEEELVRELELAACCGIPPYSPDALMEIVVSNGSIQAFLPEELSRPRRLTPGEGFALAAAARTILAVSGADDSGALKSALSKLESALGDRQKLVVDIDHPRLLEDVRGLVDPPSKAQIEYYAVSSDEVTTRVVDAIRVISVEGHWYLDAFCHRANGLRRFRVDRIRTVRKDRPLKEPPTAAALTLERSFVPDPEDVEVDLVVDDAASWIIDSVPVNDVVHGDDGETHVSLSVGSVYWLERLLLRLGPDARVVAPPELAGVASSAAARLLSYYAE